MSSIARYYDESKNPDGGALPGVPLADIDEETFNQLPEWLQRSVDASPMYRKTKPHKAAEDKAAPSDSAPPPKPALKPEKET